MKLKINNKWSWSKKILVYGIIDLFLFLMCFVWTGLIVNLFLQENMTTAFFLSDLTPFEFKSGQDVILIKYWTFGVLLILSIICHIWLAIVILKMIVWANKTCPKSNTTSKIKNLYLRRFLYGIAFSFGALIPLSLAIYFSRNERFQNLDPSLNKNHVTRPHSGKRFILVQSIFLFLVPNFVLLGLPLITSILVQVWPYYNKENCQKFYQLSRNQKNIVYLYFDRTDSWRFLNGINALDPERKQLFNDFTFYENNLSLSDTTVSSVPAMMFGYNSQPIQKVQINAPLKEITVSALTNPSEKVTFAGSGQTNCKNLSLENWYKYSLANFIAFWKYLGFGISNVCNLPYYGKESPFLFGLNLGPNNAYQMNDEMRNKFGFKNFSGTYTSELQKYNGRMAFYTDVDDAYSLASIRQKVNYIDTNTGVFTAFYSQQTHFNFAIKNGHGGYKMLRGNSPKHIARAIHDCLIDVCDLIRDMKQKDPEIYDRTMFIITSDHGHLFENHNEEKSSTNRAAGFAPVFMVKPFAGEGKHNQMQVNHSLVSTADQLAIIRSLIFKKWTPSKQNRDPWDPKNRYPNADQDLFSSYRSSFSNENDLWKREFKVMRPSDWRYMYWRDHYKAVFTRTFRWDNNESDQSVFCEKNWSKYEWNL